ncbi:MAG: HAD family hydrolase [Candidatus Nanohalobium sp.]
MNYIFDLDDTLIHNSDIVYDAVNQLWQELTSRKQRKTPETEGSIIHKLKEQYAHHHYLKTKEYTDQGLIDLAPGVKEFLETHEAFKAGHTNAPYRSTQYKLEKLGLEGLLDTVATPRTVERKPNPQGVNKLIRSSGLDRDEVVYVGDSLKDLVTGRRAGVRTILITNDPKKKFLANEHYSSFREFAERH